MSGGHWNYKNDDLKRQIFEEVDEDGKVHHIDNPLGIGFLSDLTHDIFVILHCYDWFISGDITENSYQERVDSFLKHWKQKFSELEI